MIIFCCKKVVLSNFILFFNQLIIQVNKNYWFFNIRKSSYFDTYNNTPFKGIYFAKIFEIKYFTKSNGSIEFMSLPGTLIKVILAL